MANITHKTTTRTELQTVEVDVSETTIILELSLAEAARLNNVLTHVEAGGSTLWRDLALARSEAGDRDSACGAPTWRKYSLQAAVITDEAAAKTPPTIKFCTP